MSTARVLNSPDLKEISSLPRWNSVEIMEINTISISEEFLCTVSLVSTSPQVPYKLKILQLTCFFMPPSYVSKSIFPFDHMAAGTDLLTHTQCY